jgi:cytochrome P450
VTSTRTDDPPPALAHPARFRGRLRLREFLRRIKESSIATWPEEAFEAEFLERRILWRRTFVANSPAAVGHVLLDNADNYIKSKLARRLLEPGIGRGLITSEGAQWRRGRRLVVPAFQHQRIAGYGGPIIAATSRMLAAWEPIDAPIDIAQAMGRLTLAIISEIMFSAGDDPEIAKFGAAVDRYQTTVRPSVLDLLNLPDWSPRRATVRAAAAFATSDAVIAGLIARRRAAPDPGGDLLGILLGAPAAGDAPLSAREIRDHVATILAAGHETTANALTWAWYLLALHPNAEAKLHDELDRVIGGREPGFDDIARLAYTRMVIEEAMRLYPPVHTMSRTALADDRIAGHRVPKGSTVLVVPWLLHRHRRLWQDPERFSPERMSPERASGRPRFAYIPFGAGPRICIGASLAMTEAILILASAARHWRLRLAENAPVEPVGLITLRPRYPMMMVLYKR